MTGRRKTEVFPIQLHYSYYRLRDIDSSLFLLPIVAKWAPLVSEAPILLLRIRVMRKALRYGRDTVMVVPLLSPSGSWLSAGV